MLVDRFANGDRSNDGAVDPADPAAFHGGDLQGVLDHLDDLQSLGVRTVWLSPVWKMRTEKFFGYGAFHGYWVEDYSRLEPRFGEVALLRRLSDALHARGMRLYLDVVLNHVAFDSPLLKSHPDWFHHQGGIEDWNDPEQLVNRDVMGLPDLAQENPAVYRYLLSTSLKWVDQLHPDGFRLDAVKHIPLAFWRRFNADVRAHAGAGFVLLGEDLDGNPKTLARTAREGAFDQVFDFPLHYALVDVFCKGEPVERLASVLSQDRLYPDPEALVTVLDNHDLPRILTDCHGSVGQVEKALRFQLTARGIPALTYGTEAGLEGEKEPFNRGDMRFDAGSPLKAEITRLLAARRAHPALQKGASEILALTDSLFAYARIDGDEAVVIAVNAGANAVEVVLPGGLPAHGQVTELETGAPIAPGPLPVPAQSVRLLTFEARVKGGFAAWAARARARWTGKGERRAVRFTSAGPGLEVVGSAPELGEWSPDHGLSLDAGAASAQLPVGAVVEFKLVRRGATPDWEPGPNRFVWVEPGEGPLSVPLTFGQR